MNSGRFLDCIRLFLLKNKEPYLSFYKILGFVPKHIELYEQAFVHRSVSAITFGTNSNNERLEFLGDAILDAIIADVVFHHFPQKREGFLTNTRAKIVQRESLNHIALELGLDKKVTSLPHATLHQKYLYGNALEALIGAIYLDKGYQKCRYFVRERIIKPYISLNKLAGQEVNFKSRLLELGQKSRLTFDFDLIETFTNEEGKPVFQTRISLAGTPISVGTGNTKKESQQVAAKKAIRKINKDKDIHQLFDTLKQQKSTEFAQPQ